MHVGRRPPEPLDGAVREFYEKLFALLKTDAVREGSWRLLDSRPVATDNRSNAHYLAYSWEGLSGDRLFVVVNYSEQRSQAWIEWPWSGDQRTTVSLQDRFSDVSFERSGDELVQRGMFFDEPGWKYYVFEVESD